MVHLLRSTLQEVAAQDRQAGVADFQRLSQATVAVAARAWATLAERWEGNYPSFSLLGL